VLPRTIVLIDTLSPAGGYTDAELAAFGAAFDTIGFALDTTNFGGNTDIDSNNRIAIFFTPGINQIPGPVGGVIGGLFAARDLFPANTTGCVASNEGEIFYMPVPDPGSTINGNYKDKTFISELVAPTLVHEFQHLINAGRRIFVNDADDLEEVWLNEGLSHIAPDAGAIVFVKHQHPLRSSAIAERLRDEKSVLVAPGDFFDMDGYLRIGFGSDPAHLDASLTLIGEFLASLGVHAR